jgi:hypothetical protein
MKINSILAIGSVAVSSLALNLMPIQQAQAVELVRNGDFSINNLTAAAPTGVTNPLGATAGTTATAAYWDFSTPRNTLVWLSATGTAAYSNLNTLGGGPGDNRLIGSAPILNPITGGSSSGFFVAADGDPVFSSTFSQTLTGLIAGEQYNVSFWQAAAQQAGQTGPTTEQWQVSLGGSANQLSTRISPPQNPVTGTATAVSGWGQQKENLTFTAGSTNQLLSFLAVGTPTGQPPISLLTGVSVQGNSSTSVPEPENYIGTLIGVGFIVTLAKSRLAKKKLADKG